MEIVSKKSKSDLSFTLLLTTFAISVGSAFHNGYQLGCVNPIDKVILTLLIQDVPKSGTFSDVFKFFNYQNNFIEGFYERNRLRALLVLKNHGRGYVFKIQQLISRTENPL